MQANWKPIETAPHNKFVLVACESGYTTIDWIYRVAQFTAGWHNRWDDEGGDALKDSGHIPRYWDELPNAPKESSC